MYTFLFLLTIPELFHILSFFFLMFLKRGKEMIIKKIVILNDNIIENVLYNLDFACIFFFPFSSPSTHCLSNFAFTKLQKGIPTDSAQFANTIPFEVSLSVGQSHWKSLSVGEKLVKCQKCRMPKARGVTQNFSSSKVNTFYSLSFSIFLILFLLHFFLFGFLSFNYNVSSSSSISIFQSIKKDLRI